jgi:hypothetical protein
VSIESVLAALPRYKKFGNKYRAPCPVHNGKDLNLMLSERRDGSVGGYCFVCGCSAVDVADALGLNKDEVFAPDSDYKRPVISRDMQEKEVQDKLIVEMAKVSPPTTLADKRRVQLAHSRLQGIAEMRSRANEN